MMRLALDLSGQLAPQPGNYGAVVWAGTLLEVPRAFAGLVKAHNLRTVEEFFAYLVTYPSAVSLALQWSLDEVRQATVMLADQLRPHVPGELLQMTPPPERSSGALDPT